MDGEGRVQGRDGVPTDVLWQQTGAPTAGSHRVLGVHRHARAAVRRAAGRLLPSGTTSPTRRRTPPPRGCPWTAPGSWRSTTRSRPPQTPTCCCSDLHNQELREGVTNFWSNVHIDGHVSVTGTFVQSKLIEQASELNRFQRRYGAGRHHQAVRRQAVPDRSGRGHLRVPHRGRRQRRPQHRRAPVPAARRVDDAVKLPVGTTDEEPTAGDLRAHGAFNTERRAFEGWMPELGGDSAQWVPLADVADAKIYPGVSAGHLWPGRRACPGLHRGVRAADHNAGRSLGSEQ